MKKKKQRYKEQCIFTFTQKLNLIFCCENCLSCLCFHFFISVFASIFCFFLLPLLWFSAVLSYLFHLLTFLRLSYYWTVNIWQVQMEHFCHNPAYLTAPNSTQLLLSPFHRILSCLTLPCLLKLFLSLPVYYILHIHIHTHKERGFLLVCLSACLSFFFSIVHRAHKQRTYVRTSSILIVFKFCIYWKLRLVVTVKNV